MSALLKENVGDRFINIRKLTKSFGGHKALDTIDFHLNYGEVLCLAGTNGSGKSTLIKVICGVHQPDTGANIEIDGQKVNYIDPVISRDLGIQVIYQDLSLFPNLTVAENIGFSEHLRPGLTLVNSAKIHDLAYKIVKEFNFNLDLTEKVENLPIAQRQQVAICRALVSDAKLVIMDEPTASLTRIEVDQLLITVNKLKAKGIAVVFVSHKLDEVMEISDRVTVIKDGLMVGTYDAADMNPDRLTELMTGIRIQHSVRHTELKPDAKEILRVENLCRDNQYQDVSFSVKGGQALGLCGLLGSGRTELAMSLFGITQPKSGSIYVEGQQVTFKDHQDAISKGVGYVSEDRLTLGLVLDQSVDDNTVMSIMNKLTTKSGLIDKEQWHSTIETWIDELGVKVADSSLPISSLSGGNQQKVVLAKWILTQPKLLILDSPTVGVDVGAKDSIYEMISTLTEKGVAVIIISDEVPEVYFNCDTVLHFDKGQIIDTYQTKDMNLHQLQEKINAY
ncbi:sugar ABC transporter ATP-binding protein [Vibrio natriegens]|uniref:sugar ABC transporter ATP-binding protein n=1 Tax=Vibrio natriegens TaxID=691 RepID=UPI003DA02164